MQGRRFVVRVRVRGAATKLTGTIALALAGMLTVALAASAGTTRVAVAQKDKTDPPEAVHYDTSPPLSSLPPAPEPEPDRKKEKPVRHGWPSPGQSSVPDPVVQSSPGTAAVPSTATNFDGVGAGFSGPQGTYTVDSAPPDPNGAVGPSNFVEVVNTAFAVFDKSGNVLYGPVPTNTLWSGFGGGCETNDDGDATVAYDRLANRWVISQFSVSTTPYLQCVAVSTSGDPTGSYYRYAFQYSNFPDYPKLGVWPDAYYTTFNLFNSSGTQFLGPEVCAYDRAKMLAGQAATQQCFTQSNAYGGMLPSDVDGSRAPPTGSPNYVLALGTSTTTLAFWKFHVDWTTPSTSTLTGPTSINVASYSEPCGGSGGTCIPQSGTSTQLDSLGDRLMYRLAYRNFGDHESLVVDHSVTAGSSVGVRWYELRISNGTPTVYQQGTYAPDSAYRWMGSIAMDRSGDIALGYSTSSSTTHPSIRYTGRLAGDAVGTMTQGEGTIVTGGGSQTSYPSFGALTRWGDYTSMSVDPSDDCTFWYTNEYIPSNGAFNWRTRIGSFKFPSCGASSDFSMSASPSSLSVAQGSSGTSTISTAVTSGSAQSVSLSASGAPSGTTISFNPTSVTAGGSSTMTVNVGSTTAAGTYTITVTGTGTSTTHTTSVSLTVTAQPASDFSISSSPSTLSVAQGASGTSTISTAVTSGSAQSVSLSASGAPSGTAVSFNPTSVTAGGSSTMTVNVGSGTAAGTYPITVTGTGTSATHTTSVSLTVTAVSPGGVVNGGFETGNLNGWSASGAFTPVISTTPHSGSYSARLGSTSAVNGNSTLTQTVAIPSGSSRLTFWYQPHCPDTLAYDQIQMQIRSTSGSTLATVLNVCSNSGAWTQVTYDTSTLAGQSFVLWFNDHDDGYPSDPTYFLLDDVAVTSYTPTPNVVQNPGFETGSLASWTPSGAFTPVISATPHSGSYSARLGSTSAVNGNSTLTQAVTVPTGSPTLTFWYQPHCPDTLTYDQIQMQIRSTSGSTLATVLNVCSNAGAWTQVTYNLSAYAGQSVVLWFNDHDDGYPSDPTYFLLDDVSVRA